MTSRTGDAGGELLDVAARASEAGSGRGASTATRRAGRGRSSRRRSSPSRPASGRSGSPCAARPAARSRSISSRARTSTCRSRTTQRIGVVDHVFADDALRTVDEFRAELHSARFDERRLDLRLSRRGSDSVPAGNEHGHTRNGGCDDRSDTRNLDAGRRGRGRILLWLATQIGAETSGEYWATYGLIAAAGLTMALSQILGGWTKWGWPRFSTGVFLLGFLPVLVAGGWILLARQPADWLNTSNWSRDLGIYGAVADLGNILPAIAFGVGLDVRADVRHGRAAGARSCEHDVPPAARRRPRTHAADEPLTADDGGRAVDDRADEPSPRRRARRRGTTDRTAGIGDLAPARRSLASGIDQRGS